MTTVKVEDKNIDPILTINNNLTTIGRIASIPPSYTHSSPKCQSKTLIYKRA